MRYAQYTAALLFAAALAGCDGERVAGPNLGSDVTPRSQLLPGDPSPSLTGELLTGDDGTWQPESFDNCQDPAVLVTPLSYNAAGAATGPYIGTFIENGNLEILWATPTLAISSTPRFGLLVFRGATFTINSADEVVSGEKLESFEVLGEAVCTEAGEIGGFTAAVETRYRATLPDGTQDEGTTTITLQGFAGGPLLLKETFVSDRPPQQGDPTTLTLEPKEAVNPVGTRHCVTATVRDATGRPVPRVVVVFEVRGSVTVSGTATTDREGRATFCYEGPPLPGVDVIRAFADTDGDTMQGREPFDVASKKWVLPMTTPGCEIKITNGGWIITAAGHKATFGGNAKATASGDVSGQEEYQDHGVGINVHGNVMVVACLSDKEAEIYGRATIDGTGDHQYRIKVRDLGEPGRGRDTYWITLDNGYTSGDQILKGGNVQVHKSAAPPTQ